MNKSLATIFLLLCAATAWATPTIEVSGRAIYTFTAEVNSFQLATDDHAYALCFETSNEAYFTRSADRGLNWSKPAAIIITGESVTQPHVAFDNLRAPQLIFLSFNQGLDRHRLYYTALASGEPRVIFESQDDLVNINITQTLEALRINWQTDYLGRQTSYFTVSLDQGKHFGTVRTLAGPALPALTGPVLISPRDGALTGTASPEIRFRPNCTNPVITKVELSWEKAFPPDKTWSLECLNLPDSAEAALRLPLNLSDGQYFLRLASRDGISSSPTVGPVAFRIDTRAPVIALASPSAEASDDDRVTFAGTVSEPARLSLNGQPLSAEAGAFSCSVPLLSGQNRFELLATDEAGNCARLTRTVSYAAAVPHLKILKPKANDWFKPGSTLYFEAEVSDGQNSVEDETEGEIAVNGQALADRPVYDQSARKLSGFINLPVILSDGRQTASVSLRDRSGQVGRKDFSLNIDSTPPGRAATNEAVFTRSALTVPLPLRDIGSGLDLQGTVISINGLSLEAALTLEAAPAARVKLPLADGSYEVTVLPRDNVGNTGEAVKYQMIVDTWPPSLTVYSDAGSQDRRARLLISGEVQDAYLAALNFYNGQNLVGALRAPAQRFAYDLPLNSGHNNIRVEAVDRAGNKTSLSLAVKSEAAAAGLINKLAAAPCPFSPATDRTMYFIFNFSATPDQLKIYIFDLAGTLLWRRDLNNFTGSSLAWNGVDMFGRAVGNGVYPYLAAVTVGGQTEIRKGKLIVLQ